MSDLIRKPDPAPKFIGRPAVRSAFYPECHQEISHNGHAEPCERVAIAIRLDFADSEQGSPDPVCARHVSKRRGEMVQLLEVMGAKP